MDKQLEKVARDTLTQAKADGLDDKDAYWLAVGAVNREAKKQGVIDEDDLPPEMNAASQAMVKQIQHKTGE